MTPRWFEGSWLLDLLGCVSPAWLRDYAQREGRGWGLVLAILLSTTLSAQVPPGIPHTLIWDNPVNPPMRIDAYRVYKDNVLIRQVWWEPVNWVDLDSFCNPQGVCTSQWDNQPHVYCVTSISGLGMTYQSESAKSCTGFKPTAPFNIRVK